MQLCRDVWPEPRGTRPLYQNPEIRESSSVFDVARLSTCASLEKYFVEPFRIPSTRTHCICQRFDEQRLSEACHYRRFAFVFCFLPYIFSCLGRETHPPGTTLRPIFPRNRFRVIPTDIRGRKFPSCFWKLRLAVCICSAAPRIMHAGPTTISFHKGQSCTLQSRKPTRSVGRLLVLLT